MHNVGQDNVHGERRKQTVLNQRPFRDLKWTCSPHGWWRCLNGCNALVRVQTARTSLRFVRAYVIAVKSEVDNITDSDLREMCVAI